MTAPPFASGHPTTPLHRSRGHAARTGAHLAVLRPARRRRRCRDAAATAGRGTERRAMTHVLAIDQGTTSSRAIVFDADLRLVASAQEEFPQHFPQSGWVEHDPDDIWSSVAATCRGAIERAGLKPADIAAIGITNQRETTLVWERASGRPLGRAIVWQDRRTSGALRRAARRRPRGDGHRPHRAAARPLLLRHQAQVAARRPRRRAGAGARGASSCSAPSTAG